MSKTATKAKAKSTKTKAEAGTKAKKETKSKKEVAVKETAKKETAKTKAKPKSKTADRKKNLVIVESPAKAKTLKKFLGSSYKIEASMGHVRDLPKSALGVDVENDYEPRYITIRGKGELLSKLRKEVKKANKIYLATDPDREGEAISWHLKSALNLEDKDTYRITFNEITKQAVTNSIKDAKEINMNLVDAQQARRVLDRIVGYKMSPLLWAKVKKGLSAGRVQSVLLKIISDREVEINNFIKEEYWSIDCVLGSGKKEFTANFKGDANGKIELPNKDAVDPIVKKLKKSKFKVTNVKKGKRNRNPSAPFTTSTMQQEGSKLLNFATSKTMQIAQQLYEGVDIKGQGTVGLVSYIRTDSVRISDEAFAEVKEYITNSYGKDYTVEKMNVYKSRGRSQDAHEAIRPTNVNLTPDSIKESLSRDQYRLYKLIWERFVASQMPPAEYDRVTITIEAGGYIFRSTGSVLKFEGYLIVYKKNEDKEQDVLMPELSEDEILKLVKVLDQQHFTQPPARFSEAMVIKNLEEMGIGRPSTYAPTIGTILARGYVTKESKVFYLTELGEIVNDMVSENFKDIVNIDFTAKMEEELDKIEDGNMEWKEIIRDFYPPFEEKIKEAEEKIDKVEIKYEETDVLCELCGKNMVIKMSKYGKFLACPGYPDCRNAKPYYEDANVACPICRKKVLIKKSKKGRKYFGCEDIDCKFISWIKPTGEMCPECNEFLVEKGGKNPKIVCSNANCGFMKDVPEEETEE